MFGNKLWRNARRENKACLNFNVIFEMLDTWVENVKRYVKFNKISIKY